jgi:hypothetical protein
MAQREHESPPHAVLLSCLPTKVSKRMARRAVKNHWFVSVAVRKPGRVQTFPSRTQSFPTEAAAKQFAKEMLSENHYVFAGTLGVPVRRIISGTQLYSWLEVEDPNDPKRPVGPRKRPNHATTGPF